MTNKIASEVLKASPIQQLCFCKVIVDGKPFSVKEALDTAIKVLEQQPCEDAVSRKDVHDMLENLPVTVENKWFNWLQKACIRLAELPSVTPKEKSEYVDGEAFILDMLRKEIETEIKAYDETVTFHKGIRIGLKIAEEFIDKHLTEVSK